jgi:type VI protein secretion system component VasF
MIQKKSENHTAKSSRWFYWPYWLILLLIAMLIILLIKSNQQSDHINQQLNEEPVSVKK